MANFIRAANPIWFFVDLIGLPLNDEYYISFLENTFPYLPQVIYRDNQGLIPWSDPLQFLSNGTLPDNLYFNDTQVFRLEIRRGPLQSDPLIYEINDFVPGGTGGGGSTETGTEDNQISNPQFSQINFTSPLSITTSGTYPVAPGWDLVLTGSGTATVSQLVFTGAQDLANSPVPPYALRIVTTGWTTAILQQTFSGNGALWSNEFVSMSLLARTSNSVANQISLIYSPNAPGTPVTITSATLTSGFQIVQGVIALPESTNTTLNNAAYVNMQILLPPTAGSVDISNVQVMGQVELLPVDFAQTPEETIERQIDHLFNYYKPQLAYKQIPSYLVGWDFPVNPAQIRGSTITAQATGDNKSFYAWDQTIVFQSKSNGVTISRDIEGGFTINCAITCQAAIIQYLDAIQAKKILNQSMAVHIAALGGPTVATVSLWYTTDVSLPSTVGSGNSLVLTLDANGKPATFNGNWTEIKRTIKQDATFTVPVAGIVDYTDFDFNGWEIGDTSISNSVTFMAIVVGTGSMTGGSGGIDFNSVSLVAGDIATRPAPKSFDETLRQCEYFYEKSYDNATVPGTSPIIASEIQSNSQLQYVTTAFEQFPNPFSFQFRTPKRIAPVVTIISGRNGTLGALDAYIYAPGGSQNQATTIVIGNWTQAGLGTKGVAYEPANTNTFSTSSAAAATERYSGFLAFQYVADSRLGL